MKAFLHPVWAILSPPFLLTSFLFAVLARKERFKWAVLMVFEI